MWKLRWPEANKPENYEVGVNPDEKLQELSRALRVHGEVCGFVLRVLGSHGSLWSQRWRGTHNQMYKQGRVSTLHAENADLGRPCLSQKPQFPHSWQSLPDRQRLHLLEVRAAGLAWALACPPPPTSLLRSSCGNSEWGKRFGGAQGAAFPLRDSPRGASGRRMFPRQPGDSA